MALSCNSSELVFDESPNTINDEISAQVAFETEARKNSDLQYYLVNALRTIGELDNQLKSSKIEERLLKNENKALHAEVDNCKRKYEQLISSTFSSSSIQEDVSSSQFVEGNIPKHQLTSHINSIQPTSSSSKFNSSSSATPEEHTQQVFNSKVEKAIEAVAPALINVDPKIPPKHFVNHFVARIFNGDLYFGIIVNFKRQLFQVRVSVCLFSYHIPCYRFVIIFHSVSLLTNL